MLTLNGRPILRAKAIQHTSSTFLETLPAGRTPTAPRNKMINIGIETLVMLITLLLKAVSVTAALAATLETPAVY